MFAGRITRWNDPALRRLNPGTSLPDRSIVVVHRSDSSGTTAVWTDFLTKRSDTWVTALGAGQSAGKQVVWLVGLAGKGNDGVAGMISQVDGAIGYLELAYVLGQGLPYGAIGNRAGRFVQPCPATVQEAGEAVTDPLAGFTDAPGRDAYPVTGTSYLLVDARQSDRATAAALINFLSWVLTAGQDLAAPLRYAPLGRKLQQYSYGRIPAITIGGTPLVPAVPSWQPS